MMGEGVHSIYKERAEKGGDILWHVTIKGRNELTEGIPLHMSLKVFEDKKDMDLKEIKQKVEEFKIKTPDPKKLSFKTTIFTSDRDGNKYYMLLVDGVDKEYAEFYESLKHCGTVYKKFMPHITIDKDLYDLINKDGLKPEEIAFTDLTIERGAGNTVYEFNKSEEFFSLVRETISLNPSLKEYTSAITLPDDLLWKYIEDRPELENRVLRKHEDRLRHHFGEDEELKEFARTHTIKEAYKVYWNKRK